MPKAPLLPTQEVLARLRALDGWEPSGKGIGKTFRFKDFAHICARKSRLAWSLTRQGTRLSKRSAGKL